MQDYLHLSDRSRISQTCQLLIYIKCQLRECAWHTKIKIHLYLTLALQLFSIVDRLMQLLDLTVDFQINFSKYNNIQDSSIIWNTERTPFVLFLNLTHSKRKHLAHQPATSMRSLSHAFLRMESSYLLHLVTWHLLIYISTHSMNPVLPNNYLFQVEHYCIIHTVEIIKRSPSSCVPTILKASAIMGITASSYMCQIGIIVDFTGTMNNSGR